MQTEQWSPTDPSVCVFPVEHAIYFLKQYITYEDVCSYAWIVVHGISSSGKVVLKGRNFEEEREGYRYLEVDGKVNDLMDALWAEERKKGQIRLLLQMQEEQKAVLERMVWGCTEPESFGKGVINDYPSGVSR